MDHTQIGASTVSLAGHSLQEAIDRIRALGFEAIEVSAFAGARHSIGDLPGFWFDALTESQREDLKVCLSGFGHIALQAPFLDTPLFTYSPAIQETAIAQVRETVEAAWYLGAELVTLRINRRPFFDLAEYRDGVVALLSKLGDFAAACGVVLGIETGFPDRVKDFTRLLVDIDHEAVGATVDVDRILPYVPADLLSSAQTARAYNDALARLVTLLGSKIQHVHLGDVRPDDWRGLRTPGTGIVDFGRLFDALEQVGYSGALSLELEEPEVLPALETAKRFLDDLTGGQEPA